MLLAVLIVLVIAIALGALGLLVHTLHWLIWIALLLSVVGLAVGLGRRAFMRGYRGARTRRPATPVDDPPNP